MLDCHNIARKLVWIYINSLFLAFLVQTFANFFWYFWFICILYIKSWLNHSVDMYIVYQQLNLIFLVDMYILYQQFIQSFLLICMMYIKSLLNLLCWEVYCISTVYFNPTYFGSDFCQSLSQLQRLIPVAVFFLWNPFQLSSYILKIKEKKKKRKSGGWSQ